MERELSDLDLEEDLWRYLDLGKFLVLISSRSLYLTRSDKFENPFESTVNREAYPALTVLGCRFKIC
jgi:hypothetical protein